MAIEGSKLNNISDEAQIVSIINNFIERNFRGISFNLDIDFDLKFEDIKYEMEKLKNEVLNEKLNVNKGRKIRPRDDNKETKDEKNNIIKVTSVILFKKKFTEACIFESRNDYNLKIYKIPEDVLINYDLNKCIYDNINDNACHYLLLEMSQNLATLII